MTPERPVRRHRTRRRRRPWLWTAITVGVLAVLGFGAWLVVSWKGTYDRATTAQAQLAALRGAVTAGEWATALDRFPAAQQATTALRTDTAGLPWRVLESMPVFGQTAQAATSLAGSADGVLDALDPLTPYADRLLDGDLRTTDGAIDVGLLREVQPLIARLQVATDEATARLSATKDLDVREPVASALTDLADLLDRYAPAIDGTAQALDYLPGLLGADGARTWLVLLQNPAEARGSGGFVGGYAVLAADRGGLHLDRVGTSSELASEPIASGVAPADARALWGDSLTRWGAFNVSPNFPTTAALAKAGMSELDTDVDGVIALDPAAVAAMLAVTGPITADGVTVDADNAVAFFTTDIYRQVTNGRERDDLSMALVQELFTAFTRADLDARAVFDAMSAATDHNSVQVWSADERTQDWLAGTAVGGVLPDIPGPILSVAFNNAAENKSDAFLDSTIRYSPGQCPTSPVQDSSLTVELRNDTPPDLPATGDNYNNKFDEDAPRGSTVTLVHIYAPVDAQFQSATIDGRPEPLYLGEERNRPVWWTYLELGVGQSRTIDVQFTEPTRLGVEPRVITQPMTRPTVVEILPGAGCQ